MAWSCEGRSAHNRRRDGRETEQAYYWRRLAHAEQCRADRHEYEIGELKEEALWASSLIAELRKQLREARATYGQERAA